MSIRSFVIAVAVLATASVASTCSGEAWVAKMVSEPKHDFGTVARGSDTVHRFEIKNIYKQDIELVGVRSSCGCTSPTLEGKVLKTGEIGYVVAKFNTRTFTGVHGATLTLDVKWNDNGVTRHGETQLRVDGNIRGDLVFQPGAVKFENVDQGSPAEQKVQVTYAGRSDWKITDVRGANDDIEVVLAETQRYSGRVAYDLLVRVKDSAKAGYFNDQLVLVTNDARNPRIPLHIAGRIVPQISVAPESVLMGEVTEGKQVTKKVIVRGKKPFRILSVAPSDGAVDQASFQFKTDDQPSERHIVEITFDANRQPGDVKEAIRIETDLGEALGATLTAYATVVPAVESSPSPSDVNGTVQPSAGAASTEKAQVAAQ